MIREYIPGDEDKMDFNQFSDASDIAMVFTDETFIKNTIEDNGAVKIITFWKEYEPTKFGFFILMAKEISARHIIQMKKFLAKAIEENKPKHVMTYSEDCAILHKWHRFWGFEKDPTEDLFLNGKQFNKWVMEWA